MTYDQKLRDKFKVIVTSTVYSKAPQELIALLFKWDRTSQVYTNPMIQQLFVLFVAGVTYGKEETSGDTN